MKRFMNLLRKEIRELMTAQLIISLLFMVVLFNFIGRTSRKEVERAMAEQTIAVLDLDRSASSQGIVKGLESANFKIESMAGKPKEEAVEAAGKSDAKLLLVIPSGFGDSLRGLEPREVETYSYMRSFSLIGTRSQIIVRSVISALNDIASDNFLREKLPDYDPDGLKNPIRARDFVIVKDRMAEGSPNMVAGLMSSQSMLIPIVLMMMIIRAPDQPLATVLSLIPFFAPILMFLRISISDPPVWQVLLSWALLVVTIWWANKAGGRLFRAGILLYGSSPTWGSLGRALRG